MGEHPVSLTEAFALGYLAGTVEGRVGQARYDYRMLLRKVAIMLNARILPSDWRDMAADGKQQGCSFGACHCQRHFRTLTVVLSIQENLAPQLKIDER